MNFQTQIKEVTDDQLAALAGGELLRTEGGYFGQIRNVKKPSTRLRETLINHKLALPLCLLMSTHRAHIVFKEGVDVHLKERIFIRNILAVFEDISTCPAYSNDLHRIDL